MKKAKAIGGWLAMALFSGLWLLYHWLILPYVQINPDTPMFLDYARHARLQIWSELLPRSLAYLENAYGFGLLPGFIGFLRWAIRVLDPIDLVKIRCLFIGFGILQLVALYRLLKSVGAPPFTVAALGLFAVFPLFNETLHLVRPDTLTILLGLPSILWFVQGGGTWGGALAGFLAGGALSFHPQALFLLVTLPMVIFSVHKSAAFRHPASWSWVVTAVLGAGVSLLAMDWEQIRQYQAIVTGHGVSSPLALQLFRSPSLAVTELFDLVQPVFAPQRGMGVLLFCFFVSSLVWQARRVRYLSVTEFRITLFAWAYPLCYLFFTGSRTPQYLLAFLPWWFIQAGWLLDRQWNRHDALDEKDWAILGLVNFSGLLSLGFFDRPLALGLLVCCAIVWLAAWRGTTFWMAFGGLWLILGIFVGSAIAAVQSYRIWLLRPLWCIPWFAAAFLVGWGVRHPALKRHSPALLATYGLFVLALFFAEAGPALAHPLRMRSTWRPFLEMIHGLPSEARVVGSSSLWLYQPRWTLGSTEALVLGKSHQPQADFASSLRLFSPDFAFLGDPTDPNAQWLTETLQKAGLRMQEEMSWDSPSGSVRLRRFRPSDRN